jgi:hypothetical protein
MLANIMCTLAMAKTRPYFSCEVVLTLLSLCVSMHGKRVSQKSPLPDVLAYICNIYYKAVRTREVASAVPT